MIPPGPASGVWTAATSATDLLLQGPDGDVLSTRQAAVGVTAFLLLAGAVMLYFDAKEPVRRARRLLAVEPFAPDAARGDAVAVKGPVRADETVRTPVSGADAVAYEYEDQRLVYRYTYRDPRERERMERAGYEDELRWRWDTHESAEDRVPFLVETADGPVAIEPDGASLDLPERTVEQSSRLERWFARVPWVGLTTRPKREVERFVGAGDRVLVVGTVERPRDADPDVVGTVRGSDDDEPFLVTTKSRRGLAARSLLAVFSASVPGTVVFVAGLLVAAIALATGAFG